MGIFDKLGEAWRQSAPEQPAAARPLPDPAAAPPAGAAPPPASARDVIADRVVERAAEVAVDRAIAVVRGAVDRAGESFLGDAEDMLRQGQAARAHRPAVGPDDSDAAAVAARVLAAAAVDAAERPGGVAPPPPTTPSRLERENKARAELAALKAKLKAREP